MSSALRFAQRGTVDGHGVAVMPHTAQQRIHHRLVAEKVLPLVIHQVRRDDCGVARIAFLHQLEKGVDRKSTRLNSSHLGISYAAFCLKKKTTCATEGPAGTWRSVMFPAGLYAPS